LRLVFHEGKLLVAECDTGIALPPFTQTRFFEFDSEHFLGWLGERPVWTAHAVEPISLPPGMALQDLRQAGRTLGEGWFSLAGRAWQIIRWDLDHRYCCRCGTPVELHAADRAKCCPACGYTQYPRISPCILVLITRGDQLLLARAPNWPSGFFSALAGFVEAGETLEEAVHREIDEEVGLRVGHLRYFGSQSWPFPHSLMVGFLAEYEAGDIQVDGQEIAQAHWFTPDQLPAIPPHGSLSRRLIDHVLRGAQA
jgi:NAD+ diphosphatase